MLIETDFNGEVTLDVRHSGIEASYLGRTRLHRRLFVGWTLDELKAIPEQELKEMIRGEDE